MTNLNSIKLSIIEESTTRRLDEVAKLEQDKIKLTNFIKFLTYLRSFTSDKSKAFEVAVLAFNQYSYEQIQLCENLSDRSMDYAVALIKKAATNWQFELSSSDSDEMLLAS